MRTTEEKLKKIIETDLESNEINSYIEGANTMINSTLVGKGLGASLLAEIERWVAAHMIASTRERQSKKEEAGGAKIEYSGKWGVGLSSTSYGQMAISLDASRTLQALASGGVAFMKAIKS